MQDLLQRPLAAVSADDLVTLFAGGAKRKEDWLIGLEIELTAHRAVDLAPASYQTIAEIMEAMRARADLEGEYEIDGRLIGLKGGGQIVSLEPGGQVEYATRPYRALRRLKYAVTDFTTMLSEIAAERGVHFWAIGHHPFADRDTIPRMPKARYDAMRAYMPLRGSRGLDMMHLTGSVQCAVDFSDEKNLTDKVRTAARVSPFLSALAASSPFFRGRPSGLRTMRYEIWLDTDNARSGIWPEMLDAEGLTFSRYIAHAMSAPAMFFIRDGRYRVAEPRPYTAYAKDGFEGTRVTVADFLDHLTSMFPEIRVKNYIELRGADCMPPVDAVAIAGFWRAILDDEDARRAADERLTAMDYEALRALQPLVAREGLAATSAAGPVREVIRWLTDLAYTSLMSSAVDCAECVVPLVERASAGRSISDEMLERAAQTSVAAALDLVRLR